jgi:hypothetical protein
VLGNAVLLPASRINCAGALFRLDRRCSSLRRWAGVATERTRYRVRETLLVPPRSLSDFSTRRCFVSNTCQVCWPGANLSQATANPSSNGTFMRGVSGRRASSSTREGLFTARNFQGGVRIQTERYQAGNAGRSKRISNTNLLASSINSFSRLRDTP